MLKELWSFLFFFSSSPPPRSIQLIEEEEISIQNIRTYNIEKLKTKKLQTVCRLTAHGMSLPLETVFHTPYGKITHTPTLSLSHTFFFFILSLFPFLLYFLFCYFGRKKKQQQIYWSLNYASWHDPWNQ